MAVLVLWSIIVNYNVNRINFVVHTYRFSMDCMSGCETIILVQRFVKIFNALQTQQHLAHRRIERISVIRSRIFFLRIFLI